MNLRCPINSSFLAFFLRCWLAGMAAIAAAAPARAQEAPVAPVAPFTRKFDFGKGAPAPGFVKVLPDSHYSPEAGFGFEPSSTGAESLAAEPLHGEPPRADAISGKQPFLFSVAVPEGNYRVTVTFGGAADGATGGESVNTVKAESRRLMLEAVRVAPGDFAARSFIVNVRNFHLPPPPKNAPGGDAVRLNDREQGVLHWDDKLTLEFNGQSPRVCAVEIEKADVPTVFLAGDSTVTDQPREPGASWGQMLPRFFKPEVAVANHAESGETMKSFITGLRLDKILSQMKAGDYLFIQFGHNDEKASWPQTYVEAATTYRAYLRVFIAEARRRGATPVLVTPVQRRNFDADGKIKNTHGDYPDAVRQVAREDGVALIDLAAMSATFYEALGPEKSPLAFSAGGKDVTHHDNYGAYEIARCVAAGIKADNLPLAKLLTDDALPFDPAHPDPVETFALPASPGRSNVAPRGN